MEGGYSRPLLCLRLKHSCCFKNFEKCCIISLLLIILEDLNCVCNEENVVFCFGRLKSLEGVVVM